MCKDSEIVICIHGLPLTHTVCMLSQGFPLASLVRLDYTTEGQVVGVSFGLEIGIHYNEERLDLKISSIIVLYYVY